MVSVADAKAIADLFNPYPIIDTQKVSSSEIKGTLSDFVMMIDNNSVLKDAWEKVYSHIKKGEPETLYKDIINNILNQSALFTQAAEKIIKLQEDALKPTTAKMSTPAPSSAAITSTTTPIASSSNPFTGWRSDASPTFKSQPLAVPLTNVPNELSSQVEAHCVQQYQKSIRLMEHSVGDVALQYTTRPASMDSKPLPFEDKFNPQGNMNLTKNAGPLLYFASAYSQRYLDLYEAYVEWEMQKIPPIPMLPVQAGQMKLHGFTSEEIIKMQDACVEYNEIVNNLERILLQSKQSNPLLYDKLVAVMSGVDKSEISLDDFINKSDKRDKYLSSIGLTLDTSLSSDLVQLFADYQNIPEKGLLDRAHFLMHDFGHMEYKAIATQLYFVAIMQPFPDAKKDERILMEIRHRVAGDMSIAQNSPGTLGGNPQAYLNLLKNGEPDNPEAEFRNKMYFVYMNNHFSNAVIKDDERIAFINQWLSVHNKDWKLDKDFIKAMQDRGPRYIPPIFRYGANAAINRELREARSHHEMEEFYKDNPNISVREAMEGISDLNAYYRLPLSERELLNQIGEWHWNKQDKNRPWQSLNFGTGAAVFKLHETPTSTMGKAAKEYLQAVTELGLPVFAGISGTLDQSTAMAGLVGLGVDNDPARREQELQTIKLAYLAFMLPGRDHSVHEIMQSSMSYGLDYVAGPGYEAYIYPPDGAYFQAELANAQQTRGSHLPAHYLSESYVAGTVGTIKEQNEKATLSATPPTVTMPKTWSEPAHYIGIPIAGTKLEEAINQWRKKVTDLDWVPPSNLHITIGWMDTKLTQKQQEILNKELQPILAKYQDLLFNIDNVEMWWGENIDAIVTLKEKNSPPQIEEMRLEIQAVMKKHNLAFTWDKNLHIKIGESKTKIENKVVQSTFGPAPQETFQFDKCALMRTVPSDRWQTHISSEFPLQQRSLQLQKRIKKQEKKSEKRRLKKAKAQSPHLKHEKKAHKKELIKQPALTQPNKTKDKAHRADPIFLSEQPLKLTNVRSEGSTDSTPPTDINRTTQKQPGRKGR